MHNHKSKQTAPIIIEAKNIRIGLTPLSEQIGCQKTQAKKVKNNSSVSKYSQKDN